MSEGFQFGDRVVHAGRPEWGVGVVTKVQPAMQQGERCYRVTLRFERAGLKTVSTAVAELRPAEGGSIAAPEEEAGHPPLPSEEAGWLDRLEGVDLAERMSRLPESTRDPFVTPLDRVRATLELWRFSGTGGSLLDWASAQSGLADPLSRFSRHELESYFDRFASGRSQHLEKVALEAKRVDSAGLDRLLGGLASDRASALRRALAGR